jgi:acyl transferase domain-containing protein
VSSFGFSGTNAHVLLEEAPLRPAEEVRAATRPQQLLTLSARSMPALQSLVTRYQQQLAQGQAAMSAAGFADFCFTANSGRGHMPQRLALVAASADQAATQLAAWHSGESVAGLVQGEAAGVEALRPVFLFTGQGSQYPGMGRELYAHSLVFRAVLEQCDALLRPHLEHSLLDVLFGERAEMAGLLDETAYTQPALFALEYALATLWQSWGIRPAAVMGHSVGEYVAACVAGVFSLEDGLSLIAQRGRLMQALPQNGSMAAIFAGEETVRTYLAPYAAQVDIAALNGPNNTVISGEQSAVAAVVADAQAQGIKSQRLNVSHAFHSPLMQPLLDEFGAIARTIDYQPPTQHLSSKLTG